MTRFNTWNLVFHKIAYYMVFGIFCHNHKLLFTFFKHFKLIFFKIIVNTVLIVFKVGMKVSIIGTRFFDIYI